MYLLHTPTIIYFNKIRCHTVIRVRVLFKLFIVFLFHKIKTRRGGVLLYAQSKIVHFEGSKWAGQNDRYTDYTTDGLR